VIYLAILVSIILFPYMLVQLVFGAVFAAIGTLFGSLSLFIYGYRIALSVDQLLNTLLLGFPDESISGRVGRAIETGRPRAGIREFGATLDWLFDFFFGDKDHVQESIEREEGFNNRFEELKFYKD
jgi:hypothetical protein